MHCSCSGTCSAATPAGTCAGWQQHLLTKSAGHLPVCFIPHAGVLDPSEYPGWDEEEGGALANVDAEVGMS